MIKKIRDYEVKEVLEVLQKEPCFNLFAIGDIERYGCEGDVVEVWTEDLGGEIFGVLLRSGKSFLVYYTTEDADTENFTNL